MKWFRCGKAPCSALRCLMTPLLAARRTAHPHPRHMERRMHRVSTVKKKRRNARACEGDDWRCHVQALQQRCLHNRSTTLAMCLCTRGAHSHTHTHIYIYIYTYTNMPVCVVPMVPIYIPMCLWCCRPLRDGAPSHGVLRRRPGAVYAVLRQVHVAKQPGHDTGRTVNPEIESSIRPRQVSYHEPAVMWHSMNPP